MKYFRFVWSATGKTSDWIDTSTVTISEMERLYEQFELVGIQYNLEYTNVLTK